MGFFIIVVILIIIIAWMYNKLVILRNNVSKSKSGIEVYLQQRFDLIPNLIEATKGYMEYEKDIIEKITRLRAAYNESKDVNAEHELNVQYKNIMAVVENYPELKASEQFVKLQKSLIKIESQLQAARRIYNNDATKYNTTIAMFPNNLVASLFSFKESELFSLDGEDKVNVNF